MGVNTLTVTVVDIELMPVEGATVVIAEPGHFEVVSAVGVSTPESRTMTTDVDGQAEFRLAASADYLLPASYQYSCSLMAPGEDTPYTINFTMPDRDADLHAIISLPAQPSPSTAVPPGGGGGEVLTKLSDRSYDVGWAALAGQSDLLVRRTVNAAELLALGTTRIQLVAAPGAGSYLIPSEIIVRRTGTTQVVPSRGATMNISYASAAGGFLSSTEAGVQRIWAANLFSRVDFSVLGDREYMRAQFPRSQSSVIAADALPDTALVLGAFESTAGNYLAALANFTDQSPDQLIFDVRYRIWTP